ncbi:DUF4864 domain-containing protein [Marinobacter sp. CHS3-4]|uniref:DUF4864 domain-containing protein n=1 Tax=Marinobacter sp. CHS3-4 TaxID=3045174 RepID=UPI0024B5CA9A|nr:DUF4864 domain-containing protein [Marinobacter sp. CHS3-4]MDI9246381.1 DUF4864 domain-containing protein [Marinobacter sp. CHS3-4]
MLAIAFVCLSLASLVLVAPVEAGDETDDAIQDTILSQIEAFANDDKDAAWAFASDGIKRQSGSVDTFYNMVKLSYQPVYKAASIEFLERIPHSDFHIQVVRLKGPQGKRWRAIYRMERDGSEWRIGGVALKEAPGTI